MNIHRPYISPYKFHELDVDAYFVAEICELIEKISGFNLFSLVLKTRFPVSGREVHFFDNYHESWRALYIEKKYWMIDPILHFQPVPPNFSRAWDLDFFAESNGKELWYMTQKHGFRSGITFGLPAFSGTYGIFSVAGKDGPIDNDTMYKCSGEILKVYIRIIRYLTSHTKYLQTFYIDKISFSRRELEVLRYTADGMISSEIASTICVTKSTVDFHLMNIVKKLGCRNKFQAIAKAALFGYI
ncbi:autoinducer binding domain-containing protein [Photorhabdus heterorhabditis]|uniref:LuxR family transcriptional regulator n=1 Tax=Photorhabdus heterorhabditis TaxID=880156 RepID=A0A5B0X788_9GAMM|nr:autoinducer binding domain-containing protein [Photorhabdus heterorhabditis]KAA1195102.1 LuxR family transcriptional regulator [Photorhabdus heterorhabditis]MBS9440328.1 LuxR family transcriptional regulator [Photorhabdus heterorhabditis]